MTDTRSLHVIFAFLCTLSALFSLFRLVSGRKLLRYFDAEKEVLKVNYLSHQMAITLAEKGFLEKTQKN